VKFFQAKATNPLFDANLVEFTEDAYWRAQGLSLAGQRGELGQVVTKIAATTETRIVTSEQLPLRLKELQRWPSLKDYLAGQEKQYVEMVLARLPRATRRRRPKCSASKTHSQGNVERPPPGPFHARRRSWTERQIRPNSAKSSSRERLGMRKSKVGAARISISAVSSRRRISSSPS
jgi:hypothetical protein